MMKYSFQLFVLILLVLFLIVYGWCQLKAPDLKKYIDKYNEKLIWAPLQDLYDNAKNGDLIFFSGNTKGERTCRWCTGSMFSHVGILFREIHEDTGEDILYIWDSDIGQKTKDGPRVMVLKDKINRYKGYPFVMWRKLKVQYESERPTTENFLDVISKYKNYDFDNKIISWWVSNFHILHEIVKSFSRHTLFCSELIALTMQHESINILNKYRKGAWYSPASFYSKNIDGLKPNYSYENNTFIKL